MTNFFAKKGVKDMLTIRQLFEFAVDSTLGSSPTSAAERIAALQQHNRNSPPKTNEDKFDEAVFMKSFIPRTLHDVSDPIAELDRIQSDNMRGIYHATVSGLSASLAAMAERRRSEAEDSGSDDEESDAEATTTADNAAQLSTSPTKSSTKRRSEMTKEERKQHKKDVKAERRAIRVHKQAVKGTSSID